MSTYPLLSLAIWIPIIAGLVVLATGSDRNAPLARMLALFGAIAGFLVTIPLWTGFDVTYGGMQFLEVKTWIPRFNVNYHLGVDGISMLFHRRRRKCQGAATGAQLGAAQPRGG